jgi:flagellar basal body-associated protein FliL
MNRKIIIAVIVVLLVFVLGFVSTQFLDVKLPFADNGEIEEYKFPIDGTIITNIKNSRSYVKCDIVLTITNEDEFEEIVDNSHKIKHAIIEVLRSMEEHEYYQDNLQNALGDKIITKLIESFEYENITEVYFEQLITQ